MNGAVIRNAWKDGRDASVSNDLCFARSCLRIGEDKGAFSPGRGYTSYYANPQLVCMTRMCHGCPHPMPEPDPERVRCCPHPNFPEPSKRSKPQRQTCRTCRTIHRGKQLELARTLEKHEYAPCRHPEDKVVIPTWRTEPAYECLLCRLWWRDVRPKPHQPGLTHRELLDLELKELEEKWKQIRNREASGE